MSLPVILGAINSISGGGGASGASGVAAAGALGRQLGPVTASIGAFTNAISSINAPVIAAADQLRQFTAAATAMGRAVEPFVRLANPGVVQRFTLASEDLTASIGRFLVPVMLTATNITRAFADVMFKLSGPLNYLVKSVFDPLTNIIPKLTNELEPLLNELGDLAKITGDALKPFVTAITQETADALRAVMPLLKEFANELQVLALVLGNDLKNLSTAIEFGNGFVHLLADINRLVGGVGAGRIFGASTGAAARPATTGSIEDYGRQAQLAAFSLGTGAMTAEEKSADYLGKIWDWLSKIDVRKLVPAVEGGAREVRDRVRDLGMAGRALEVALPGLGLLDDWIDRRAP